MALHPELPFTDQCLLYMQDADAARYVVHKGIADYYKYPTDHPMGVYGLTWNEEEACFDYNQMIVYEVPRALSEKNEPAVSIEDALERIGYGADSSDGIDDLFPNADARMLYYPKGWSKEERMDALLGWYIDYFWEKLSKRQMCIKITDADWKGMYRSSLLFMMSALIGYEKTPLSKQLIANTNASGRITWCGKTLRQYVLSCLLLLYVELDQAIEGRHFTFYDSLMFRSKKDGLMNIKQPVQSLDLFFALESFKSRYSNVDLSNYQPDAIHIYPPAEL